MTKRTWWRAGLGLLAVALFAAACSGGDEGKDTGFEDACGGLDGGCGDDDSGPRTCSGIGQCPAHHLCIGGFCQLGTLCIGPDDCPGGYTCNVMQEVCVPDVLCTGDPDCEAPTARCLVSDGVCVQCTPQTQVVDCGPVEEAVCNASFECEPVGPDCSGDADCAPPKPRCDPSQGKCVACVTNDHCTPQVCRLDTKICVDCYTDNHCVNPNPRCWLDTSICVECTADAHCSGTERCNQSSHSCTDLVCTVDADCANQPGPYCDAASGDCVACKTSAHCGALQWCRDFTCQSGCLTDPECVEKMGAGYRCDTNSSTCFFAECLTDPDCAGNPDGAYCKLDEIPSNPARYTCVECTADAHCTEYETCKKTTGKYVCEPLPCYLYQDPAGTCAQIDACYDCSPSSGNCEPRYDCASLPCCQGYSCNGMSHCERNLNCQTNADCAVDSICNQQTLQCEYQSCCGDCQVGWYCNEQSCECELGQCKNLLETCSPAIQNCCEGLRCAALFEWCVTG